jgi:hypothetical protein
MSSLKTTVESIIADYRADRINYDRASASLYGLISDHEIRQLLGERPNTTLPPGARPPEGYVRALSPRRVVVPRSPPPSGIAALMMRRRPPPSGIAALMMRRPNDITQGAGGARRTSPTRAVYPRPPAHLQEPLLREGLRLLKNWNLTDEQLRNGVAKQKLSDAYLVHISPDYPQGAGASRGGMQRDSEDFAQKVLDMYSYLSNV